MFYYILCCIDKLHCAAARYTATNDDSLMIWYQVRRPPRGPAVSASLPVVRLRAVPQRRALRPPRTPAARPGQANGRVTLAIRAAA